MILMNSSQVMKKGPPAVWEKKKDSQLLNYFREISVFKIIRFIVFLPKF